MVARVAPSFWERVERGEHCWEWTGAKDRHGAGVVWWEGRTRRAAAVAFALTNGRWSRSAVKTSCGNPACCRPEHLVEAAAVAVDTHTGRVGAGRAATVEA
jgi:hypothetical protein